MEFHPLTYKVYLFHLFWGILFNLGLWFITTEYAKKYKLLALGLYLPPLLLMPPITMCLMIYLPILYIPFSFFVLVKYYPWRPNAAFAT